MVRIDLPSFEKGYKKAMAATKRYVNIVENDVAQTFDISATVTALQTLVDVKIKMPKLNNYLEVI